MHIKMKTLGLAALLSCAFAVSGFAITEGAWSEDGKQFILADGSAAKNQWIDAGNNVFYYVDENGNYVTGWKSIKAEGSDAVYEYYFSPESGEMFYSAYTPTGYYVNADGVKTPENYLAGSEAEKIELEKAATVVSEAVKTENSEMETAAEGTDANGTTGGAEAEGTTAANGTENGGGTDGGAAMEAGAGTTTGGAAAAESEETVTSEAKKSNAELLSVELFNMINDRRMAEGKAAYAADEDLKAAAMIRAEEIAAYAESEVKASPGIIYNRPKEYVLPGTDKAVLSSVTAVPEAAIASFKEGDTIYITELPVYMTESTDGALFGILASENNKAFLLDTPGFGFNSMGVAAKETNGKLCFSIFIGKRQ